METKDLQQLKDSCSCINCYFYASGFCSLNCEEANENETCDYFEDVFQH